MRCSAYVITGISWLCAAEDKNRIEEKESSHYTGPEFFNCNSSGTLLQTLGMPGDLSVKGTDAPPLSNNMKLIATHHPVEIAWNSQSDWIKALIQNTVYSALLLCSKSAIFYG